MITPKILKVQPLEDYNLELIFANNEKRIYNVNTGDWRGVFAPLKDLNFFRKVRLKNRTASWPNGADIAPEELYKNSVAAA
jgi:hypothetical protein